MATFKQAFAAARAAGKKTFTWKGNPYTTEVKGAAPKPAKNYSDKQVPSAVMDYKKEIIKKVRPRSRPTKGESIGMQRRLADASDSSAPKTSLRPRARNTKGQSVNSSAPKTSLRPKAAPPGFRGAIAGAKGAKAGAKGAEAGRKAANKLSVADTDKMSFAKAFGHYADKTAQKTFSWRGKRYSTKRK